MAAGAAADTPAADTDTDPMAGWNAWDDAYAFRYVSDATGDEVLLKAMVGTRKLLQTNYRAGSVACYAIQPADTTRHGHPTGRCCPPRRRHAY